MIQPRFVIALACAIAGACSKSSPTPTASDPPQTREPAKPDLSILDSLPPEDLVGYLSGNYHTTANNPAIFYLSPTAPADRARGKLVMMGRKQKLELPIDQASAATEFEHFLLAHGYQANGKTAPDDLQHVKVNGKDMVVMSMDELLPEMPKELAAHFTPAQSELLYHTRPIEAYERLSKKYPLIWASGTDQNAELRVLGPGYQKTFPIGKTTEAFAAFLALTK